MMDDANAPGLVSMAYLGCASVEDPLYRRTRAFALSDSNPYFFKGKAAEGVGGPHEGLNMVWPMGLCTGADFDRRCGDTDVPALAAGFDSGDRVHA